jgi:hypothetical protein
MFQKGSAFLFISARFQKFLFQKWKLALLFSGIWKDGMKCGMGVEVYKDKSQYKGEWENNLKNGGGTFIYAVCMFIYCI